MRKTKIMLLAALVATPFAMANDYGYDYGGYEEYDDVTIEGSFNKAITLNADATLEKTYTEDYVGNQDNDKLLMYNVGNSYDKVLEDNSQNDWSVDSKGYHEWEELIAESAIDGAVMGNTVTYGGACCKSGHGTDVIVDHSNTMHSGYQAASGINIAGQNVGNNSMVQQTTSTNAALVGSGGATLPGGGGSY
ncbi:hypothetical protein PTW35_24280 (plasmid) [Photobacterium sp. DA100]|uniref:hypothetical protein n=1 Tax=Photobacterium sp. DA100 TaxID=3027472 RepID=UPI00247B0BF9|nr:hypothetical protein [Photobacterium sp. DA100]WEM44395.1 hypothetical protein PTW35_24280 [Photobacterium sp. DA100]